MESDPRQREIATGSAEEILRLIYGEDLTGCAASVDSLATVILEALQMDRQLVSGLLTAYETSIAALQRLSAPPAADSVKSQPELHALLSERLDAIHQLTLKVAALSAAARKGTGRE